MRNAEDRGAFFITPGTKVYRGMIVGEHNRSQDLELNICKTKQLTNHRAAGGDELVQLQAPIDMSLERALEYIGPRWIGGSYTPIDSSAEDVEEVGETVSKVYWLINLESPLMWAFILLITSVYVFLSC